MFVTVAGWGMTAKCVLYLMFPRLTSRMIANADRWQGRFGGFRLAGALGAVLGGLLS